MDFTAMYALKYTQSNMKGTDSNCTLLQVREPHGVWRDPKNGATFNSVTSWLVSNGYEVKRRSHSNGAALRTVTELWDKVEEEIRDPYEDCESFTTGCVVDPH